MTDLYADPKPLLKTLNWVDWAYALLLLVGGLYALNQYGTYMDVYEKGFLFGAVIGFSWLGWFWKPVRPLLAGITVLSLFGISQYHGDLARAGQAFFLKFLLSSQSAVMWMNVLFARPRS